jgi:hypothetical protein
VPNVYSDLLSGSILCSVGTTSLGTPPVGFKWVVKDITTILYETYPPHSWTGFSIEDASHFPIFARLAPWAIGGVPYEWHGSQVIDLGVELNFVSLEGTWRTRVSGYQLVLP